MKPLNIKKDAVQHRCRLNCLPCITRTAVLNCQRARLITKCAALSRQQSTAGLRYIVQALPTHTHNFCANIWPRAECKSWFVRCVGHRELAACFYLRYSLDRKSLHVGHAGCYSFCFNSRRTVISRCLYWLFTNQIASRSKGCTCCPAGNKLSLV